MPPIIARVYCQVGRRRILEHAISSKQNPSFIFASATPGLLLLCPTHSRPQSAENLPLHNLVVTKDHKTYYAAGDVEELQRAALRLLPTRKAWGPGPASQNSLPDFSSREAVRYDYGCQ
jgi:hypothetical protein